MGEYAERDSSAGVAKREQLLRVWYETAVLLGTSISLLLVELNPFRTAVPFWGQTTQFSSSLSPKRDCGCSKGVKAHQEGTASTPAGIWLYLRRAIRRATCLVRVYSYRYGTHSAYLLVCVHNDVLMTTKLPYISGQRGSA